ncbi:MAG: chromate transporter [Clostridia bacterium]
MSKFKKLLDLFFTFFKIGALTFGAGYAMISVMQKMFVEKKKYISDEEMINMISIAESTPGAISVNMSTFIGYKIGKFSGALVATLGLVIPSFICIILISLFLNQFKQNIIIAYALKGISACVVVLIFNAFYNFFKKMDKKFLSILIFACSFLVAMFTEIDVIYIILASGIISVVLSAIFQRINYEKNLKAEKLLFAPTNDVSSNENNAKNLKDNFANNAKNLKENCANNNFNKNFNYSKIVRIAENLDVNEKNNKDISVNEKIAENININEKTIKNLDVNDKTAEDEVYYKEYSKELRANFDEEDKK